MNHSSIELKYVISNKPLDFQIGWVLILLTTLAKVTSVSFMTCAVDSFVFIYSFLKSH